MRGISTSDIEVTNVTRQGIWICVNDGEHFLSYADFPWFRTATIDQILNVELLHGYHLHWPDLEVDLELDSLGKPEEYPLIDKGSSQ